MDRREINGKQIANTDFYEVGKKEEKAIFQEVCYNLSMEEWIRLSRGIAKLLSIFVEKKANISGCEDLGFVINLNVGLSEVFCNYMEEGDK